MGLIFSFLLAACGSEQAPEERQQPTAGDHRLTIEAGGKQRAFLVHAPPGFTADKPVPLVIALHFFPGDGERLRTMIGMDAKADEHHFLVAYPDGLAGGFNALICCGAEDDVGFLKALTDKMIADWGVDANRVYATGISNGADMSFRLAVEATGVFAAVAPISGGFGGPNAEAADYKPAKPVSVLTVIGTLDKYYDVFEAGLTKWRERLKCQPARESGDAKVKRSSARCADGSDLEIYVVTDMGHSWPGARTGEMALVDAPIVATDLIWDFFAAHPRVN
ncbi:PHB depolymerase family esterase [Actinoplanes sp. NPDC051861]|uniref:alpha/beta hydrolase family esterase n=1 Tax=Actinoplanes sp. NPDC051861 TaxID=3155170 RepID=UPI00343C1204